MAEALAMFFAEQGKVLSEHDYFNTNPVPYPRATLRSIFGSYPRAVNYARFVCPDLFKEFEQTKKEPSKPKVDPLEALKVDTPEAEEPAKDDE